MPIRLLQGLVAAASAAVLIASAPVPPAAKEFPPPQGQGRVVVVASGQSGPEHYETVSAAIAKLGYDVVLFDGNPMEGTRGAALKSAIPEALAMPHALPGKVAVVGFSLGGGVSLGYASLWSDQVAVDIVWYPATRTFSDIPAFAKRIKVPVLMFAGEADSYKDCCLIATARRMADAATAAGAPFELVTYPRTDHDFVEGGSHYNAKSYQDALGRTAAKLKEYLGG